jgi:hypothetical protein
MKKIILFALLAISATMTMAQINPKSGSLQIQVTQSEVLSTSVQTRRSQENVSFGQKVKPRVRLTSPVTSKASGSTVTVNISLRASSMSTANRVCTLPNLW